ncbi:hypothetical protein [Streptomyces sp. NPDC001933]|uniref:hypothetical protein n=1 Tax=Streptomyces sp. NPDC001933 TaxID=3364626 RepID=UPI00368E74F6
MARHLDWLITHSAASDFTHEVAMLVRAAEKAARPDSAPQIDLGPCVHPGCDSQMYAQTPSTGEGPSPDVRCDAGHVWPPHQWLLLARRLNRIGEPVAAGAGGDEATGR